MKVFDDIPPVPQRTFYGQGDFPQPYICSLGYITSTGVQGSFVTPSHLTYSKTGTGVYLITHKLGKSNKYVLIPTITGTTAGLITTANINDDTVEVRTFVVSGTPGAAVATDLAFSFVIYSF